MTNNNWCINFPDNPYEGQIFYYPRTQDTFTYVIPKKYPENVYLDDKGEWVLISYDLFMNFTKKQP